MAEDYKIFIPGLCLIFLTYSNPRHGHLGRHAARVQFRPAGARTGDPARARRARAARACGARAVARLVLAGRNRPVRAAGRHGRFRARRQIASYAALVLSVATACCWLQKRQPQAVLARVAARSRCAPGAASTGHPCRAGIPAAGIVLPGADLAFCCAAVTSPIPYNGRESPRP